ncbi:hypothetical protein MRB53_005933 [Persea americana]|uniref:Uncharacterized protein n=1 Tax=Persea americana TaxID=3435 RepID=A0ACC2MES4_PERAE|nr:hypothetical protein MRB53_005933 [Persea americana]
MDQRLFDAKNGAILFFLIVPHLPIWRMTLLEVEELACCSLGELIVSGESWFPRAIGTEEGDWLTSLRVIFFDGVWTASRGGDWSGGLSSRGGREGSKPGGGLEEEEELSSKLAYRLQQKEDGLRAGSTKEQLSRMENGFEVSGRSGCSLEDLSDCIIGQVYEGEGRSFGVRGA